MLNCGSCNKNDFLLLLPHLLIQDVFPGSVSDLETTNKDKSKEKESNDLTKEKVLKKSIKDKKEIKVP